MTIIENGLDPPDERSVEYRTRLNREDRSAILAGELTNEEIALIAAAKVSDEYADLDEELADWHP